MSCTEVPFFSGEDKIFADQPNMSSLTQAAEQFVATVMKCARGNLGD